MPNLFMFLALLNFICVVLVFFEFGRTPVMTVIRSLIGFGTLLFALGYVVARANGA